MIKRPMLLFVAAWLAGLILAKTQPDFPEVFIFIAFAILILVFVLFLKFQPKWLDSRVLPTRYPQLTLVVLLLPCLLLGGFYCMKRELTEQEQKAYPWKYLKELGEDHVFVTGTVREKRCEEEVILILTDCVVSGYSSTWTSFAGDCQVRVEAEGRKWLPESCAGNEIQVYGKFSPYLPATNPGQFDACEYYSRKNLFANVRAERITVLSEEKDVLGHGLFQMKQALRESIKRLYPPEKSGVLTAMILGDKDLLEDEVKDLYQKNGISHILAISGLHISMLCMGLFRLMRRCSVPLWTASGITVVFLMFYIVFTGAGTSSLRAGVMCLVMLGGVMLRRSYDLLSSLSFAAILVTAVRPTELWSAGFLLSFGAVIGVAVGSMVMEAVKEEGEENQDEDGKETRGKLLWKRLRDLKDGLLPGFLIQCVTTPISLWFFYELSPYSVFLNFLILPLVALILGGGIASALLGMLSPYLGGLAAGGTYVLLELYERLGEWTLTLTFSYVLAGRPDIWQMVFYYGCLVLGLYAFVQKRLWCFMLKKSSVGVLFLVALLGTVILLPQKAEEELLFLDVSQGDGALILTEEGTVLLSDCGSSDVSAVGEYRLAPALKQKGISVIDLAVVSHMDGDHTSGIKEVLEAMKPWKNEIFYRSSYKGELAIRKLILPKVSEPSEAFLELVALAEQKNVEIEYREAGEVLYREKGLLLECLSPLNAKESDNDTSLVFLLQMQGLAVWFMGDAGVKAEEHLMTRLGAEAVSHLQEGMVVLKVGHHGSKTSSSEAFLSYVEPDVSVISCGYQNRYGHPHGEVLETLERESGKVFRTDLHGAVMIRRDKKGWKMEQYTLTK